MKAEPQQNQTAKKDVAEKLGGENGCIEVWGARVHNLKNVDVKIPRDKLTVITGLSGSGKSSLAFDTLFAEGQRRYIETFSAYARNFLGNLERPDVDKITGLSPVISIEQKTTNKNPRSTVGTTTEIYDYLRLLYARAGEAYSYVTGERMVKYTDDEILDLIYRDYEGERVYLLAPMVKGRKGHYKELFEQVIRRGYLYVRVDGELQELKRGMRLDRYRNHDIEVVVDKLVVEKQGDTRRLKQSIATAMKLGEGIIMLMRKDSSDVRYFSRHLMCPTSGISYSDPAPYNFSFNSPKGACPRCKGLGVVQDVDPDLMMPNRNLSIAEGGILPLGKAKKSLVFWQIEAIGEKYGFTLKTPIREIPDEAIGEILYGTTDRLHIKNAALGSGSNYFSSYDGVVKYVRMQQDATASATEQKWASQFVKEGVCPECDGQRLNKEALHYRIWDKNISDLAKMDIVELKEWVDAVEDHMTERQLSIAREILKEIRSRLKFLLDVGLDYLSLDRATASLSGGESQRIRLATQIGSQLVNVLYILDEPSIGLHQRDNERLIRSLQRLRDMGNTVIVVEHDQDMMLNADYVVDMGPKAGRNGGKVIFSGTPKEMLKADTLTSSYLNGKMKIEIPESLRSGNGQVLRLKGARGNNLKNVTVEFPLATFICVTGVSGSGKSSLINDTLQPILSQKFYHSLQDPLPYDGIEGLEYIDKVVQVDQSPIGRTPRSNPATYTGLFSDIRNLFVSTPEAKIRGYKPGRFSFNTSGGRCEACGGNGYKTIEMNFLPDVYIPCEECHGRRYNRETLEVKYKGKSIADVLDMTINQAVEFFENVPVILRKLKVLQDVGLGYIKVGQSSTTLSGGESQRVKLATELSKKDTGRTLFILDEPTTGLHFEDIRILLEVLNRLVERGNTVIVIEHNLDVIKSADYVIEMGPEGGKNGGQLLFEGTPQQLTLSKKGYTGAYLKPYFKA
ncbi:MAG: excinuclease ABC subunit UvrA [Paludibacteraceae bacterium]|nr:excinuclease ABC subunit UvrA [Paludibacteraceae bacterium]